MFEAESSRSAAEKISTGDSPKSPIIKLISLFGTWLAGTDKLSGMLFIRKTMAAIRALLKKRKLFYLKDHEVAKRGSKTTKNAKPEGQEQSSRENWLILLTDGLEEVSKVSSYEENSHERILYLVLDSIGLLRFLTDVWQWQEVDVCQDFVYNWDHKTKTTTANGIHIDASYKQFLELTGLEGEHSGQAGSSYSEKQGEERKKGTSVYKTDEQVPISQSLRNDPVLQSLLLLLNRTLWFARKQSYCPTKDMVYLLVQSMRGHKLDWSRCVYEKFICEIRELQDRHENHPDERLETLAGPLMCFLYAHAKDSAEGLQEDRDDRGSGRTSSKEKNLYEYDDGDVVSSDLPSRTLKLPYPSSSMLGKRRADDYNLATNAHELASKTQEDVQNHEIATTVEEEISSMLAVGEGIQVTEDVWNRLNKAFEEQKHRQECFKSHLRQSWKRVMRSECEFGCCQ